MCYLLKNTDMNLLSIDNKVSTKISKMADILSIIENYQTSFYNTIDQIYLYVYGIYLRDLSPLISSYKLITKTTKEIENKYNQDYSNIMHVYNINMNFNEFITIIRKNESEYELLPDLLILISDFININTVFNFYEKRANMCCGQLMNIDDNKAQYSCIICGLCKVIDDPVFDEKNIYSLGSNYSKTVYYQHTRTLDEWINNILCKNDFELKPNEKALIDLEVCNKKYGPQIGQMRKLTIEIIRKILRKTKMIQYNNKAAKILSIYTGVDPPLLSGEDIAFIKYIYYDVINMAKENVNMKQHMPDKNQPYCPFFIYKIVQTYWETNSEKREILKFIHMQNDDTTKKMDLIWFEYCKIRKLTFNSVNFIEKRNFE